MLPLYLKLYNSFKVQELKRSEVTARMARKEGGEPVQDKRCTMVHWDMRVEPPPSRGKSRLRDLIITATILSNNFLLFHWRIYSWLLIQVSLIVVVFTKIFKVWESKKKIQVFILDLMIRFSLSNNMTVFLFTWPLNNKCPSLTNHMRGN